MPRGAGEVAVSAPSEGQALYHRPHRPETCSISVSPSGPGDRKERALPTRKTTRPRQHGQRPRPSRSAGVALGQLNAHSATSTSSVALDNRLNIHFTLKQGFSGV